MSLVPEKTYKYRWVILSVLWISYIVVFLNRLSVGPMAPFLKAELDITNAQVGMVMSAASLGLMITLFPAGWVVDKIGARWPIFTGEMIAGISMLAMFFVPSYTWLLAFMFVTGLGCGFLMPATAHGVAGWFPVKERATAMGLMQTTVNAGGIIGALTLPAVALTLGWRYGFLFLGFIAIAIGITALILYKEPPTLTASTSTGSESRTRAVPLLEILKNREIWLVGLAGFFLAWVEMAVIAHVIIYLKDTLLFSVVVAGGLLALVEVAGAIGRPIGGILSDRISGGKRKPLFMLMAGIAAAMSLLLGFFGTQLSWAIYPVLFLLGFGGIGFSGVWIALITEFGGQHGAGKAAGLGTATTMGGVVLGPIVFGYIIDATGSYQLAWLSLAITAAVCLILLLFVNEEKRKI